MSASLDLSLIVHTRNRREMLHPLLRSTAFIGERIIVDMASDDGSAELCEEAGCRVVRIPAETFVDELRNRYLPLATRGWTLLLDSDEYLSADAEGLIAALIAAAGDRIDAYGIPRFNYIGADRLPAPGWYPDHQIRLFRTGVIAFQKGHHQRPVVLSGDERLALVDPSDGLHIHHQNYRDLKEFIARQLDYALTDDYAGARDLRLYLAEAYEAMERGLGDPERSDLDAALAIVMAWDRVVRGVIHWEASGRTTDLARAFSLPLVVEQGPAFAALEQRVRDFENSTSWRVTAPLRRLSTWFRSIRQR